MKYRHLGSSGLKISELSFGAWVTFADQFGEDTAYECMKEVYDAGVNFFDNAEGYAAGKAETIMGNVIKKAGWKRSDLIVSTKIFFGTSGPNDRGLSRKHIVEGTEAALRRLQMDYVDLLYCHRPDVETPIEESVRAMSDMVTQGKAIYWGTSEWSAEEIRHAYMFARQEHLVPPTMEQPEYNMFQRARVEREYAPLYRDIGLGTTIWSPLASGILTGKYADGIPKDSRLALEDYEWLRKRILNEEGKRKIEKTKKLTGTAKELGCTLAQLAIAWCLKNPRVSTVITGASKPRQVVENMKAPEIAASLTPEVMQSIEDILDNKPEPPINWRGA